MSNNYTDSTHEFSRSELNFYGLLKIALLLDCEHILEWDCLQLFGHSSVLKLNRNQQRELYYKSRKAILGELERSNDPALMRVALS